MATGDENASVSSRPSRSGIGFQESSTPVPIDVNDSPSQTEIGDPSILPLTDRHKSKAWEHFTRKRVRDEVKAECNYCHKQLAGGPKAGTTHLHEHTRVCPKRKCQDIRQSRLFGTLASPTDKSETLTLAPYEFRQEDGRRDLAEMIILHDYPLSMVEHYGFRKYSNTLQPGFKVPSRNTTKKDILLRYGAEKDNIAQLLAKTKGRIALTTDMWTASNQKKGYMAVTAHFIDNSWRLQSQILRFMYVPAPHTKDVLAKALLDCIYTWNLDLRLSSITVDNCSTNDAVMDLLAIKLPYDSLILGGKFLHMRCCAHILNLIVQDGLSHIGVEIERVRDSVAFWTSSVLRVQKFEEVAKQIGPKDPKKLALDCKTRWNSTYEMLKVAIMHKLVFTILKGRESQMYKSAPSEDDWEKAEKICEKLELFYDVTNEFSASKYPTANIYFSKVCEIRISLREWLSSHDPDIKVMAATMLEKYNKYWCDVNGLLAAAAILDPRYKIALVRFYFKKLFPNNEVEGEVKRIRDILQDLLNEYGSKHSKLEATSRTMLPPSSSQGKGKGSMDEFAQFMEEEGNCGTEKSDLDKYLGDPNVPLREDFDILAWWKANGSTYPILQKIARDILSIPVSTVPSESAFSCGGRLLSPHRSRLLPRTVEALMCAQNWISTNIKGELKEMEYSQLMVELEEEEEEDCDIGITDVTCIE